MTDIDMLYAAILADPDDDLARYAYADALEERNKGRDLETAAFIRGQLIDGSTTVVQHYCSAYFQPETFLGHYMRGFIKCVTISSSNWMKFGPRLIRNHPIQVVKLINKTPPNRSVIGIPLFTWFIGSDKSEWEGNPHIIPRSIFEYLMPSNLRYTLDFRYPDLKFSSREAAEIALSDACIAWALAQPH
jgi:uncharacterized protein (TIGR02996 family)